MMYNDIRKIAEPRRLVMLTLTNVLSRSFSQIIEPFEYFQKACMVEKGIFNVL